MIDFIKTVFASSSEVPNVTIEFEVGFGQNAIHNIFLHGKNYTGVIDPFSGRTVFKIPSNLINQTDIVYTYTHIHDINPQAQKNVSLNIFVSNQLVYKSPPCKVTKIGEIVNYYIDILFI